MTVNIQTAIRIKTKDKVQMATKKANYRSYDEESSEEDVSSRDVEKIQTLWKDIREVQSLPVLFSDNGLFRIKNSLRTSKLKRAITLTRNSLLSKEKTTNSKTRSEI